MVSQKTTDVERVSLRENTEKNGTTAKELEDHGGTRKDCFFLYFAAFAGCLTYFGIGISVVWTSPVVPKLESNNTDENPLGQPVSSYDVSLMMGLYLLGNLIMPVFTGKLADIVGRRNSLVIMAALMGVSFLMLAFSPNVACILVARTLSGLCVGGLTVVLSIFLSEISDDHNRGKLGCMMGLFAPCGQLFSFIMGSFLSVKYFSLACVVPNLLGALLLFFFVPEPPIYLLHKGRRKSAVKALAKYRSNLERRELEKDIELMEFTLKETAKDSSEGWLSLFQHPHTRRALLIGFGLTSLPYLAGVTSVFPFIGSIFQDVNPNFSGNMIAILVGCLKISVYFFITNIVEKLGRKPLMLISCIACGTALLLLGSLFYLKENNIGSYQSYSWFVVGGMLLYVLSYATGIGPIPVGAVSELFPTDLRSSGIATITFGSSIFGLVLSSAFPIMMKHIGVSSCMWMFCGNSILGAFFVYFVMPETRGKSFYEIQEMLKGKKE